MGLSILEYWEQHFDETLGATIVVTFFIMFYQF